MRPWQFAAIIAAGFVLTAQIVATLDQDLGGQADWIMTWTYYLLEGVAIAVTLARVILVPEQRVAWGFFAFGLIAWTAGDLYYSFAFENEASIPYPSFADALYGLFYLSFLAGMLKMGGRIRGAGRFSFGLIVCLLGLATIWSWLVYGLVIDSAMGSTSAILVTVGFPLMDLILLGSAMVAVAGRGWRLDRAFAALIFGFTVLAVVDLIYAAQVANGTYVDGSLLDVGWSVGALSVAAASWLPAGREQGGRVGNSRFFPVTAALGAAVALAVMVVDHFERVDTATLFLAAATLVVSLAFLLELFRAASVANEQAAESEALRSASIDAALDCILTIDARGVIHEWNRAAETTFGYAREQAVGSDFADLMAPAEMREAHRAGVAGLNGVGDSPLLGRLLETMAINSEGEAFPVEMSIARLQGEPEMFTGFIRDISERRRREEENHRLADIVRSSRDAIHSIDLDGVVTAWNHGAEELYGYTAEEAIGRRVGDLTVPADRLHEVASMIDKVLREGSAALVTERRSKTGEPLDVSMRVFPILGVDDDLVGVSVSAHDVTERRREEMARKADAERELWVERIKEALAREEFEFWAQPVIDPATGTANHHELLIRLRRNGEIVSPGEFLPHAESSGLITEIDRWAIAKGIGLARTSPVAINISGRSLAAPGLSTLVADELRAHGTRPEDVTFEITETAAAENLEDARALVEQLGELGCGVALDDFGTGYGTFSYLKFLPVSELKIDMSFIRDLTDRDINRRVVQSIVTVADTFHMKTVAEGVEDERTMDLLIELGVDLVQGYHLGRPSPWNEVAAFAASR